MDLSNDTIQEFHLLRVEDISGTSGTGVVARGVKLPSGACILEWCTFHSSINMYKNLADVEAIHGHGGATRVVMGPPAPSAPVEPKKRKPRKKKENTITNDWIEGLEAQRLEKADDTTE